VDGTLIEARAVPAIRPSIFAAHNVTNTRMPRTTDPVARRHQEVEITSRGSPIAFENRSGLVVNIKLVQSSGTSERGAARQGQGRSLLPNATSGVQSGQ
jgi:hypothetical protein